VSCDANDKYLLADLALLEVSNEVGLNKKQSKTSRSYVFDQNSGCVNAGRSHKGAKFGSFGNRRSQLQGIHGV